MDAIFSSLCVEGELLFFDREPVPHLVADSKRRDWRLGAEWGAEWRGGERHWLFVIRK
jgi:hypothetical protein